MDLKAGERLTIARKRKGLTQRQLAEMAGAPVTFYAIREYESCRRDMRADSLAAICQALGITTQEILGV